MNTALILGASGDIGTATARTLAAQGWSLYLHFHHNQAQIDALVRELVTAYPRQDFFTLQADLTDVQAADQIVQQLFAVDAVVVAAGMTYYELFADTTVAHLTNLLRVHLLTPMALIRQLQDKLARSGHGRIVFIGSVYGEAGSPMEVGYSTVKGAQSAFAHAYAQEVASLGITVNVVAPGAVDTKMNAGFGQSALAAVTADIPAQRLAQPADIAYFVATLLSEKAGYLTGQTLNVTGGWLR
ncbi:elongation factor P 5-aminopentanone reductase [Lacticaseibacillus thailandensis]|uniref:3-oxoacyl-acyl carrier protein reductase n=1 Tax=Lacticaseibacillus thailandensis DSM 22698 = JCM 13996 TaxID=1423810 RepID=A0A0R2CHQ7_9LACO|nr:SDR family oxidoreductase [Lacticaseibacillus thailandensis]KRM87756.1 3-oxoacyl-acyl carrier protein reductase [Lacticaseibacillus thailandensis DSM 22698 = JCM 13996]